MLTAAEVAERPRLTLTTAEIVEITGGLKQPAAQLRELHRQGYVRAHRPRGGAVVLPRAHFEAVNAVQSSVEQNQAAAGPNVVGLQQWALGRQQRGQKAQGR